MSRQNRMHHVYTTLTGGRIVSVLSRVVNTIVDVNLIVPHTRAKQSTAKEWRIPSHEVCWLFATVLGEVAPSEIRTTLIPAVYLSCTVPLRGIYRRGSRLQIYLRRFDIRQCSEMKYSRPASCFWLGNTLLYHVQVQEPRCSRTCKAANSDQFSCIAEPRLLPTWPSRRSKIRRPMTPMYTEFSIYSSTKQLVRRTACCT